MHTSKNGFLVLQNANKCQKCHKTKSEETPVSVPFDSHGSVRITGHLLCGWILNESPSNPMILSSQIYTVRVSAAFL